MMMKRVVVTGLGAVTPLASCVQKSWSKVLSAVSGVSSIENLSFTEDVSKIPVRIAGQAKDFVVDDWVPKKDQKKMGRFIHLALASSVQAIRDSHLNFEENEGLRDSTGVLIGVGIGALPIIEGGVRRIATDTPRLSPFFIPSLIANSASGYVSIKWGLRGFNFATVSACASGAHAIGESWNYIRHGRCPVVITGGAESTLSPLGIYGFHAMRALSTRNDEPQKASRPWDKDRDGFILSEGAAVLVLEEEEHAKKRGANIYAELVGYGSSSDSYHIAAPHPDGSGAKKAMQGALDSAKMSLEGVDYINAHGTSTPLGDLAEAQAIEDVFKEHSKRLLVSSTKSMTGHTLGAAGAVESVFSIMSIKEGVVPPTINLDCLDEKCPKLDFVPHQAKERVINTVLNNSFGFGGTNVSLIFKRYE